MEPMVVCALGIAIYVGYLTVKEIAADLRQEGLLLRPTALARRCKRGFKRFLSAGVPQHAKLANYTFLCRSEIPYTRLHQPAASQMYRIPLG